MDILSFLLGFIFGYFLGIVFFYFMIRRYIKKFLARGAVLDDLIKMLQKEIK